MQFNWDLIISLGRNLAGLTSTLIDDRLVDLLEAISKDATIGTWFAARVEAGTTTELSPDGVLRFASDEPPQEIVEQLFDGGVFKGAKDITEVAALLKQLLPYAIELAKLVKFFTNK